MVQITVSFSNENGDGIVSFLVAGETPNYGFDTERHIAAINRAMKEFRREQPQAMVTNIQLRHMGESQVLAI